MEGEDRGETGYLGVVEEHSQGEANRADAASQIYVFIYWNNLANRIKAKQFYLRKISTS